MNIKYMAGRPTDYSEDILTQTEYYIEKYKEIGDAIPSVAGLAVYLKLAKSTVYDWASQEEKKPFSDLLAKLLSKQEQVLLTGGLNNTFNSTITKLVLYKHDYKEKSDVTSDDKPIINVINYNPAQLSSETVPAGTPEITTEV